MNSNNEHRTEPEITQNDAATPGTSADSHNDTSLNAKVEEPRADRSGGAGIKVVTTIVICLGVLALGIAGFLTLSNLKRPPAQAETANRAIPVDVIEVQTEDVQVTLSGHISGRVRALNVVSIAPEVSGTIVKVHPKLEVGETIPKGEVLFTVDQRDYRARVEDGMASVSQWGDSIARLSKQYEIDRGRLKTLERNRELARAEFDRSQELYQKDDVGSPSGVEAAERAYNQAMDQADLLAQAVELYPIRIREAKSSLASAKAKLALAQTNFDRTQVRAPFDARVKKVTLEAGQYVVPGANVLTLADDSILEISVGLNAKDSRLWLRFNGDRAAEGTAWFNGLEQLPCKVRWYDEENRTWNGLLHRVERVGEDNQIYVAVRIEGEDALSNDPDKLPLVEGMYCAVEIPGRMMKGVYRVPRWAVSFENTVYVAVDSEPDTGAATALQTKPVTVLYEQGEETFVSAGLEPGERVVVTRLINPLPGSELDLKIVTHEDLAL